jgi:hypothetical protein
VIIKTLQNVHIEMKKCRKAFEVKEKAKRMKLCTLRIGYILYLAMTIQDHITIFKPKSSGWQQSLSSGVAFWPNNEAS